MAATVAMIGLTHPHTRMYLETLDALPEVAAVVLHDANEAVAQEMLSSVPKATGAHGDLDAALAHPGLTHALVAMPNDRAPAILARVIDAGLPLFTEKPGARTAAEFAPVLAALARRPVPFTVAYLNRWHPTLRELRDLYSAGAIGRLLSLELRMVTTQVHFRDPAHWLFQREVAGGGILTWLACHWLDLVRYITGEEFTRVSAELATLNPEPITVEDTAAVSFRLSGGAVGSLHAGYLLATGRAGYEGGGYDQAVILRGTHGALSFARGAELAPLRLESSAPGWRNASPRLYQQTLPEARGYGGLAGLDFFRAFLNASADHGSPADATDALRILELLDAIYEAGSSGRAVEVQRQAVP